MKRFGEQDVHADAKGARTILGQRISLRTPLTSTSFDGDSFSDTAKTKIDMSAVFSGFPASARAVLFGIKIQDSGSVGSNCWIILSPNDTAGQGLGITCTPINDRPTRGSVVVPCDASGDVYYQIEASGANNMDVWLEVWGYDL